MTVTIYSIEGRTVTTLADHTLLAAGVHTFLFDASRLASGVYLVRALCPGESDQVQKVMRVS